MKAVVFTLGCKLNECESDSLIEGLVERGYEVSDKLVKADLYIVNTCAVTKEAEKKSRQTVSRILRLNKKARIIFAGCAAQKNADAFKDKSNVSLVIGNFSKNKIIDMLDEEGVKLFEEPEEFEEFLPVKSLRARAYIKVQDGCNRFCSYCIVPYLRGRSRSRNTDKAVEEIASVKSREVVINGIDLSAYNYNGTDLTGLIKAVVKSGTDKRIRLGSLEARVITDDFLAALKSLKNFAPHFHLSLQSGSDKVLKSMNRHYTAEEYANKVDLIRRYFPDAGITTDIIAGFPGETDEDFNDTLRLIDRVKFSDIHAFAFSPREGTPAYKMKAVPPDIKKARAEKLAEVKGRLKTEFALKEKGKIRETLIEKVENRIGEGYTENYLRTYVLGADEADVGKIIKVKVSDKYLDGVTAEMVK